MLMNKPTLDELKQSIEELEAFKVRLKKEMLLISKKLKMPQSKIDLALSNHLELKNIENAIKKIKHQINAKG